MGSLWTASRVCAPSSTGPSRASGFGRSCIAWRAIWTSTGGSAIRRRAWSSKWRDRHSVSRPFCSSWTGGSPPGRRFRVWSLHGSKSRDSRGSPSGKATNLVPPRLSCCPTSPHAKTVCVRSGIPLTGATGTRSRTARTADRGTPSPSSCRTIGRTRRCRGSRCATGVEASTTTLSTDGFTHSQTPVRCAVPSSNGGTVKAGARARETRRWRRRSRRS